MKKLRLFVALNLSPVLRKNLAAVQNQLRYLPYTVKWVGERNFHITLAFLGEVEETQLNNLYNAIRPAMRDFVPFDLALSELGAFPHLRTPRVLWVGLSGGTHHAGALAGRIRRSLQGQGLTIDDKPWRPHITLGRIKAIKGTTYQGQGEKSINDIEMMVAKTRPFMGTSFRVEKVDLMCSKLTRQGPIYSVLKTFPE